MFIYIHKALLLPTSMCQTPSKRRTASVRLLIARSMFYLLPYKIF